MVYFIGKLISYVSFPFLSNHKKALHCPVWGLFVCPLDTRSGVLYAGTNQLGTLRKEHILSRYHSDDAPVLIGVVLFAVALIASIAFVIASHLNVQTETCTVEDKYEVNKSEGATKFRVETTCGIKEVGDTWLRMKFDSADRYALLDEGESYELTTIGFRVPILSAFPNIIEIEAK